MLIGGSVAAIVGLFNSVSYKHMINHIAQNLKSTTEAILILLTVGALAGSWLVSGIVPAMIYYGLKILNPTIFLPATVIICAMVSVATGSSWTTSATVGIALIGIGKTIGLPLGMVAGAVVSGAYFGDKMSPLSDTTNLASAMAGSDLFDHIRYMALTTVPSITITLIVFIVLGLTYDITGSADSEVILAAIDKSFNINGWLFIAPLIVIFMIIKKTKPLIALLTGVLFGGVFALFFQPDVLANLAGVKQLTFESAYKSIMKAFTVNTAIETNNADLNDLFSSGGMNGMLTTIWLIICAMVFGGVMEGIGALQKISSSLLSFAHSVFGLFASTVVSCVVVNTTASDQYLAIVVPGKMFSKAYKDKGLAPENLSRTLEDSGTVTSVLVPWNTCGAYQSGVLGVPVVDFFVYAIFNWLSPFMTLTVAYFNIKIKQLSNANSEEH